MTRRCGWCQSAGHAHLLTGCLMDDCPCGILDAVVNNRAAWVKREQRLAANRVRRNQRAAARRAS